MKFNWPIIIRLFHIVLEDGITVYVIVNLQLNMQANQSIKK